MEPGTSVPPQQLEQEQEPGHEARAPGPALTLLSLCKAIVLHGRHRLQGSVDRSPPNESAHKHNRWISSCPG